MKQTMTEEEMASRVAMELEDGYFVNVGFGLPLLVAVKIPPEKNVMFQTENGVLGAGLHAEPGREDIDLSNAGDEDITAIPGASFFDSAVSFDMIRGGHLDATVLGAFQVSEMGDLANWKLPERKVGSYGGAIDLAVGARKVIAMMKHVTKDGQPRVVKKCSYPLTAKNCVKLVVTDIAVIDITPKGALLREVAPGWTPEEVQKLTEAKLITASAVEWKR